MNSESTLSFLRICLVYSSRTGPQEGTEQSSDLGLLKASWAGGFQNYALHRQYLCQKTFYLCNWTSLCKRTLKTMVLIHTQRKKKKKRIYIILSVHSFFFSLRFTLASAKAQQNCPRWFLNKSIGTVISRE